MLSILLSGFNGKMGKTLQQYVKTQKNCHIVAGIDRKVSLDGDIPIYTIDNTLELDPKKVGVVIDFSHESMSLDLLKLACLYKWPLVYCTTGLDEKKTKALTQASQQIPIFFSANMSIGINLMLYLIKKTAKVLDSDFDIEIIEKHHSQKLDAPSGTAFMLAKTLAEIKPDTNFVYGRKGLESSRKSKEIGIHSIRGGSIIGEHKVLFAGSQETLEITHKASSREVFAKGAIQAAFFLKNKPPALYNMQNLLQQNFI